MADITFAQVEAQLDFFSDEQLRRIASKARGLLRHAKKRQEDPFYSESNMRALRESGEQFRTGRVVVKTMAELEAMANG